MPGSQTDLTTRVILKAAGLNPDTEAQIIPIGSTVNSMAAMGRGALDAMLAAPPVPEIAVAQFGAVRLFSVGKDDVAGLKSAASQTVIARAADVERNPDLYRSAVMALTRALRVIVEKPDAAGEAVYKSTFSATVAPDVWPMVWNENRSQFQSPYVRKEGLGA